MKMVVAFLIGGAIGFVSGSPVWYYSGYNDGTAGHMNAYQAGKRAAQEEFSQAAISQSDTPPSP